MVEALSRNTGVEQRPTGADREHSFLVRNSLIAHAVAFATDRITRDGLNPQGRRLVRHIVVRAWRGERISVAREVSKLNEHSRLNVEVKGEEHIPSDGPTIFIANHTPCGPFNSLGQFFEMIKVGENARSNVSHDQVREPFLIMQRGLGKAKLMRYLSGVFYDIMGNSFGWEIAAIPEHDESGEIANWQGFRLRRTVKRVTEGGAMLWPAQGRESDPDDFRFPEKATGFLRIVSRGDRSTQVVPVRSIPDSLGNIKIVFGRAVEIDHVVANGGINYFAKKHIAPLK